MCTYVLDEELFASIFAALLNVMGLATTIVSGGCTSLLFPHSAQPDRHSGLSNAWKAVLGNKDINNAVVQIDLLVEAELRADIVQLLVNHKEGIWSHNRTACICPNLQTRRLRTSRA